LIVSSATHIVKRMITFTHSKFNPNRESLAFELFDTQLVVIQKFDAHPLAYYYKESFSAVQLFPNRSSKTCDLLMISSVQNSFSSMND
jgi:hypothetical protein